MSTTISATRHIIKTDVAGWFDDPISGKKTRRQDGDVVVTRAEYEQMVLDAEDVTAKANIKENTAVSTATPDAPVEDAAKNEVEPAKAKPEKPVKEPAPEVTLTSGKVVTGATVTIKCAWVDPDKRTKAQEKLFAKYAAGDRKAFTYEKVLAAAGDDKNAKPDGRERTIKKQDAFQARFHPDNQDKWRAELRRIKNKIRRETARKAAKATEASKPATA